MSFVLENLKSQCATISYSKGGPCSIYCHDLLSHWISAIVVALAAAALLFWMKRVHHTKLVASVLLGFAIAVGLATIAQYNTEYDDLTVSRAGIPLYIWHWQWAYTPNFWEGVLPLNFLADGLAFSLFVTSLKRIFRRKSPTHLMTY